MRFKETNEEKRSLIISIGLFAIPVALTTLVQRLFNVIDTMMAGRYVGADALAAVGSTGTITGVILGLGAGFAVGTNVLIAKAYGEKNDKKLKEMIQLSVWIAIIIGILSGIVGFTFAEKFLLWLNTPADILEQAVLYMRIYCLGMVGLLLYNTGGAVLRGMGDSKGPFYALTIAGITNIGMKAVLVVVFDTGVMGLAIATTATQYISALCVLFLVARRKGVQSFFLQRDTVYIGGLKEISIIGISSMVEGVFFDVGNLLFQSSLNSFGSDAIAGNAVSGQVEALIYPVMNCFYHAAMSFAGQNYGAGKYKNIDKVVGICCGYLMLTWFVFGGLAYLFRIPLFRLFTDEPGAIQYGLLRLQVALPLYFFCGVQEVLRASLRGMNYSVSVTLGALFFICVVRAGWICTVFQKVQSFQVLMLAIPVSYLTATIGFAGIYYVVRKKRILGNYITQN